jgi:hypothetical protein
MEHFCDESNAGTDHYFIIFTFVLILRTVKTLRSELLVSILFLFALCLSYLHGAWHL